MASISHLCEDRKLLILARQIEGSEISARKYIYIYISIYISKAAYLNNIELSRVDGKVTIPEAITWLRSFQSSKRQLCDRTFFRSVNIHSIDRYVPIKNNFLITKEIRRKKMQVYYEFAVLF